MKLNEIQSKLKAPKNQFNAFGKYKYRSCEDIFESVKELLGDSTLTISDEIKTVGQYVFVESTATFKNETENVSVSAQAGITERKGMDIAQSFGSSSSYARKYALNGLFLIDDTKDADSTNTHVQNEVKSDAEKKLKTCKSLEELKTVFSSLSNEDAIKFMNLKDELKKYLK